MKHLLDFSNNAWINVLKVLIIVLGLPLVGLGAMFMLEVINFAQSLWEPLMPYQTILWILLGSTIILFILILWKGLVILSQIQKGDIYTLNSVRHIHLASLYSGLISLIYVFFLPIFYIAAQWDDAPGFILLGLFFVLLGLAFALFLFVIKRLLIQAIQIKEENDLVV